MIEIVPLNPEYLDKLLSAAPPELRSAQLEKSYFSPGSISYCLVQIGIEKRIDERTGLSYPHYVGTPMFAGGIVNLQWKRGEAWILPCQFLHRHLKTCYKAMKADLPRMAIEGGFRRVQATCIDGSISAFLFRHLGFTYEGTLQKFGPNGETCRMYSRIFEVQP